MLIRFVPDIDARVLQPNKALIPILVSVKNEKDFLPLLAARCLEDSVAKVTSAGHRSQSLDILIDLHETNFVSNFIVLIKKLGRIDLLERCVKCLVEIPESATHLIYRLCSNPALLLTCSLTHCVEGNRYGSEVTRFYRTRIKSF